MSITGHDPPRPRTLEEAGQGTWVLPDGRRVPVTGKAAAIMAFVALVAGELNASDFFTLTVDASQGELKPKLERRWAPIRCAP